MCFDNAADRLKNNISILVGIFFIPNSVILIASVRFNFATDFSPLLSFFYVLKLLPISDAIALVVDFPIISLIIFMSSIPCFIRKIPFF